MTIVQDAYHFRPEEFVAKLSKYRKELDRGQQGYSVIHKAVIKLFDQTPCVRELSSLYGGWDKNAVANLLKPGEIYTTVDVGFFVALLLYSVIDCVEQPQLSLGDNLELIRRTLADAGWAASEIDTLIYGSDLKFLVYEQLYHGKTAESIPQFWNHISPNSTAGRIGWLSPEQIDRLIFEVTVGEHAQWISAEKRDLLESVYQSVLKMLTAAKERDCSLCLIVSG